MDASLRQIKDGWAALGRGWAVFGATREEALRRYREAEARHDEINRRAAPVVEPAQAHRAQGASA